MVDIWNSRKGGAPFIIRWDYMYLSITAIVTVSHQMTPSMGAWHLFGV